MAGIEVYQVSAFAKEDTSVDDAFMACIQMAY